MKTLILALVSIASLSQAQATEGTIIAVRNFTVDVYMPPSMATVQPYAMVTVHVTSCAARQLEVKTEVNRARELEVTIYDKNDKDCHGPQIDRAYELQISSDYYPSQLVRLKNPIAATYHYSN